MTDRDRILAAARRNAPAPRPLPEPPAFGLAGDPVERFRQAARATGARVLDADGGDPARVAFPDGRAVAWAAAWDGSCDALAALDGLVCRAAFGVAENGAVWLAEPETAGRVGVFLAPHVAVVVARADLVGTMHEAYARLAEPEGGYGVFVAGPSKTADIEQSLVVGAHGPLSLAVVLT